MTNADWTTFPLLNPVVVQYYSMYGNRSDPRRCLKMRVMEGTHGGGDGRCRRRQYEGRRKARNGCSCNASHQFAARKVARAPERDSSSGRGSSGASQNACPRNPSSAHWRHTVATATAATGAGGRADGQLFIFGSKVNLSENVGNMGVGATMDDDDGTATTAIG